MLNFTNDSTDFELMEVGFEHKHDLHDEDDEEVEPWDVNEGDEDEEDEYEDLDDFDDEEWQRYVDEDGEDMDGSLEDSYTLEDFDEEDDL